MHNNNHWSQHKTAFGATFYVEKFAKEHREDPDRINFYDSKGRYIDYLPLLYISEEAEMMGKTPEECYDIFVDYLEKASSPTIFMEVFSQEAPLQVFNSEKEAYNWVVSNYNVDDDYSLDDDPSINFLGEYIIEGVW